MARSPVQCAGGFLFSPGAFAKEPKKAWPGLYALYVSTALGVSLWFFIFYPEPLYYGTSGAALQKEVPSIIIADPLLGLAVTAGASVLIFFAYNYLLMGTISRAIMVRLCGGGPAVSEYLGSYAYSLTPLLFWIPVMALRIFFFERWINIKPMWPFIDWNAAAAIHLAAISIFLAWKLAIEAGINRALFRAPLWKALVPVAVQLIMLAGLLVLPSAANQALFDLFKDTLT